MPSPRPWLRRRGASGDHERIRELVRASGLQHQDASMLGLAVASRNTSFVYGTDEPGWLWELYYTVDDDPRIVEQATVRT
jgi:hypothetical protein